MQQKHWLISLTASTFLTLSPLGLAQEQIAANLIEQTLSTLRATMRPASKSASLDPTRAATTEWAPTADLMTQTVNYCERVKNSEYVKHYVKIAKEFHENNALQQVNVLDQYFDNSDRILSLWLQKRFAAAAQQVGGSNAEASVMHSIKSTIDLCAYDLKDTELQYFFTGASMSRMNEFVRNYEAVFTSTTQGIHNESPVSVLARFEKTDWRYSPGFVSIAAFAFPGVDLAIAKTAEKNLIAMQTALDQSLKFKQAYDVALALDEKIEQERLTQQRNDWDKNLKTKEEQEAYAKTPEGKLFNAYVSYLTIKKCYDERDGFSSEYITKAELDRAHKLIKQSESSVVASQQEKDSAMKKAQKKVYASYGQSATIKLEKSPQFKLSSTETNLSNSQKNVCKLSLSTLADLSSTSPPPYKRDF